jgi:hypothetical protein
LVGQVGLDADTVKLPLDPRLPACLREGLAQRRLAGGEHRLQRPADLQPEPGESGAAAAERRLRRRRQRPAEHDRPPHLGPGHAGRPRDRVGHHPVERPLPQFPGEQPDEEELLLGGGGR